MVFQLTPAPTGEYYLFSFNLRQRSEIFGFINGYLIGLLK